MDTLRGTGPLDWSAGNGIENWTGITVEGTPSRVTKLELPVSLTGHIPPSLGLLGGLETLQLSFNGLSGVMPPQLGNLVNLRFLGVEENNLRGKSHRNWGS